MSYCSSKRTTWVMDEELVRKLIKAGSDVNATYTVGNSPLVLARLSGKSGVIKLLESSGAREK
jgi:hypothetical protein